jgi:hypothetical protein
MQKISSMPRFIFYLEDGLEEWIGEEALAFPGIAEAEQHARAVAAELARNGSPSELQDRFIVVKNIDGTEVVRVPLSKTRLH